MTFGWSDAGAAEVDDGEPVGPAPNVDVPPTVDRATEDAVETAGADVTAVVGDGLCPGLGAGTAGAGRPGTVGSGTAAGGAGVDGAGAGGTGAGGAGIVTGGGGTVTVGTVGMGTVWAAAKPASRPAPTSTVVAAAILMPE